MGRQSDPQAGDQLGGLEQPNLAANNPGGTTVQPENYGRFLVSTASAIRAVQPAATVLFGGLYMPGGIYYNSFLEEAENVAGEPSSYTAVAIHPYRSHGKVTEVAEEINSVASRSTTTSPAPPARASGDQRAGMAGGERRPAPHAVTKPNRRTRLT